MEKIKVIGLQRSGTNYLEALINENFKEGAHTDPLVPFFKHSYPDETSIAVGAGIGGIHKQAPPQQHPGPVVFIYKKLPLWINSIERYSADLRQKRPEIYTGGRLDPIKARQLWTNYMEAWVPVIMHSRRMFPVRYVDLLKPGGLVATLKTLEHYFGLHRRRSTFKDVAKVPQSRTYTDKMKSEYIKEADKWEDGY